MDEHRWDGERTEGREKKRAMLVRGNGRSDGYVAREGEVGESKRKEERAKEGKLRQEGKGKEIKEVWKVRGKG